MCSYQETLLLAYRVPGIAMDDHMAGKEVGSVDAIQGSMEGVLYNLWAMKELDYVMKMMATGGSLIVDDSCHSKSCCWIEGGVQTTKEFTSTLLFNNHFRYPHAVDDHNNLRHSLPS